jgi:Mg-chelatase subunit ChlD
MLATLFFMMSGLMSAQASSAPPSVAPGPHRVDVCFALDTTGSMASLIDTAKEKVWFIANEIVRAPSRPQVRFCLMAFRDRGDEYVTRHVDLTEDIDTIHKHLLALQADGGGDHPEAVNQALLETVQSSAWSPDPDVLKLIFLVGDAPPHQDYDEPQYPEIAALARQRGVIINPVMCGNHEQTRQVWEQIASHAAGRQTHIANPADRRDVSTPMDQDLAVLGPRLDQLVIPYGPQHRREALSETAERVESMSDAAAADRLSYKAGSGRLIDSVDLIAAVDRGDVRLDSLETQWLPQSVRSMSQDELIAHLGDMRREREEIRAIIAALVDERRAFLAGKADRDSFEAQVSSLVLDQLARHPGR